jgi:hypothetical protein
MVLLYGSIVWCFVWGYITVQLHDPMINVLLMFSKIPGRRDKTVDSAEKLGMVFTC